MLFGAVYFFMVIGSLYLLCASRSPEVYTVWGALHPAFFFIFFLANLLFVSIVVSSVETEFKILVSIVHSILCLSFYVLVFPFGKTGVPQMVLGEIRLVFDNVTPLGLFGWSRQPASNFILQAYNWTRIYNLETLSNVVFARMFSIDVYWTNLLMIPLLWGAFVPAIAYGIAKELTGNKRVSAFAGLAVLLFPTLIFWGTFSTHNSLGFIFFFASLYASLKYLSSNEPRWPVLMFLFSLASSFSHILPGIMSFSFLLLAVAFKFQKRTAGESPAEAKVLLLTLLVFCATLLPLILLFYRFFSPVATSFSLNKLSQYSLPEVVGLFSVGQLLYFGPTQALVFGIGSLLGLIGIAHYLRSFEQKSGGRSRMLALFLLAAFLIVQVDYRIIKMLMVNVPFEEERIWVLSDFIAVPFVSLLIGSISANIGKIREGLNKASSVPGSILSFRSNPKSVLSYAFLTLLVSGWITASVYYAYPSYEPLQTTPYEVEAVRYIDETTDERYIVIGDQWIIFAGEMVVGVQNPRAFYFFYQNSSGVALFTKMRLNPSNDTLLEATDYNNAAVAYFVVEQPRLGTEEFTRVIQQAQQNKVALYRIFGEGKLYVFTYRK
jgi:hypothetical protein